MAQRPIFLPEADHGLVGEAMVEFEWFPGFAVIQKQRSIASLHAAAVETLGVGRLMEVSTKSPDPLGVRLSAFNLSVEVDGEPNRVLLEAAFQGSKVFATQGPFTHLYAFQDGRAVKRFMNELPDDQLTGFRFVGHDWPLSPRTAFYDWLYLNSLRELVGQDDQVEEALLAADGFTDIEFNPDKSINCQARSSALYVALTKNGTLTDALTDPDAFIEVLTSHGYGIEPSQGQLL
jgi:hypothetical protein|tara:strand:+ start:320 stop:1021 length:702 start_codon:yes stop_codon:yes gene_type:complete